MNLKLQIRNLEQKVAKLTAERDALKKACHAYAAKARRSSIELDWSDWQLRCEALQAELDDANRRLMARDPQQRREHRRAVARAAVACALLRKAA